MSYAGRKPTRSYTGAYGNPWQPALELTGSVSAILKMPFERPPPPQEDLGFGQVRVVEPNFSLFDSKDAKQKVGAAWLGHAGFLVQLPCAPGSHPIKIVFDPMFADRASPSSYFGPWRRLRPPCNVEDLPTVDFVVLSHNHYDHMDLVACSAIYAQSLLRPDRPINFIVPTGLRATLASVGIDEQTVHEYDWWDEDVFPDKGQNGWATIFACTPAQHNSGRGVWDQNRTLWASWVVHRTSTTKSEPVARVYHAGDTGYLTAEGPCPVFKEIGERYGPFDLAMIPIWRGASLSFLGRVGLRLSDDTPLQTLHASPEDAVSLARDVRSKHALAMHFATFAGSVDEAWEPLERLALALRKEGREIGWRREDGIGAIDVGECVLLEIAEHGGIPKNEEKERVEETVEDVEE